jgi:ribonuclease E
VEGIEGGSEGAQAAETLAEAVDLSQADEAGEATGEASMPATSDNGGSFALPQVAAPMAPVEAAPASSQQAVAEPAPTAAAVAAPAPVAAPVAASYVLPLNELQGIAQAAGLEWVNSDADKIMAAQEAIASEPRPVHVPRERKPPVVLDEGPLILVETRKDLSQVSLPFEQQA